MADAAVTRPEKLGPATEALIASAFADAATVNAKTAARLLGVDPKTLAEMRDAGLIRAVPRGTVPAYTEADLRRFLCADGGPAWAPKMKEPDGCPSTNPSKALPRHAKVVAFSALQARRERDRRGA